MDLYVNPVWFKVKLFPPALMDFIGRTPPEVYCLAPAGESVYYGMAITDDIVEYLVNEFLVDYFEIVDKNQMKNHIAKSGVKTWGNSELLDY